MSIVTDELHFSIQQETEAHDTVPYEFIPISFENYIGQDALKKKLHIYTTAAAQRKEALDHMLLFGPPGLGKTTLAIIIAHTMSVGIKICSGPTLERTGDLVAILTSLEPRGVLFIDEMHRMPTAVEEILYSAMEQFRVDVIVGQGAGAQSVNITIHPFTLIGATTKSGMISAPLRSRFGILEHLDFYNDDELAIIVTQSARFLGCTVEQSAALLVAQCSRGTPRIAKKLFRRIRDFAQIEGHSIIKEPMVQEALKQLGIEPDGLTAIDIALLKRMLLDFNGGPVGLSTLACLIGEDQQTIEQVYEPFLLRKGYLERTPRGRQIPARTLMQFRKRFLGQTAL